jgi:hypothetical protein
MGGLRFWWWPACPACWCQTAPSGGPRGRGRVAPLGGAAGVAEMPSARARKPDGPGSPRLVPGRERRADAVLVVGECYEGALVSLPPGQSYGWLRLLDPLGNSHLVYWRVNNNSEGYKVGDILRFRVAANDKGAYAEDASRAEKDEAA